MMHGSTRLCMVGYGVTPISSHISRGKIVSSNPGKFNVRTKSSALKCLEHTRLCFDSSLWLAFASQNLPNVSFSLPPRAVDRHKTVLDEVLFDF